MTDLRLSLLLKLLVSQKIQQSYCHYTKFIFFAVNIITYNNNLSKVVVDGQ